MTINEYSTLDRHDTDVLYGLFVEHSSTLADGGTVRVSEVIEALEEGRAQRRQAQLEAELEAERARQAEEEQRQRETEYTTPDLPPVPTFDALPLDRDTVLTDAQRKALRRRAKRGPFDDGPVTVGDLIDAVLNA